MMNISSVAKDYFDQTLYWENELRQGRLLPIGLTMYLPYHNNDRYVQHKLSRKILYLSYLINN